MSEYCYACLGCGNFKEFCTCINFDDPMEPWRSMGNDELFEEMRGRDI